MTSLKEFRFLYISLLIAVLTGCGGGSDVVVSSGQESRGLPIPQMVRSLASSGKGELKAYIRVNSGNRQLMTTDTKAQEVSLTIKGLGSGVHQFSIEFIFEPTEHGEVVVATASQSMALIEGVTATLGFEEQVYDIESHDDDGDNIPNLRELEDGTYFRSEVPVIKVSAPQDVTIEALNQNIRLNWSVVEGASSYNIYMAEQSGVKKDNYQTLTGGMKHSAQAPDTTFLHPVPLVNGTDYYFVVTAVDSDGVEGSESVQIQGTPIAPLVEPPADLSPDPFSFSDQTEVSRNTTMTSAPITVNGITAATEISVIGGTYSVNGDSYTSTVGSVESGDQVAVRQTSSSNYSSTTKAVLTIGGVSAEFNVTTMDQPLPLPAAPQNVTVSDMNGNVSLSWSAVDGASDYRVYLATTSNVSKVIFDEKYDITNGLEQLTLPTSLTNGIHYYFVVTAINSSGEGVESTKVFVIPRAVRAAMLVVSNVSTPVSSDQKLIDRLKNELSYSSVTLVDDDDVSYDVSGVSLVIISESTKSTKVLDAFKATPTPVLVMEVGVWDDMKMATGGMAFWAWINVVIDIVDASHPLAAGYSGLIVPTQLMSESVHYFGGFPAPSADVVATIVPENLYAAIFSYDKGQSMIDGYKAPDRRVGFFPNQDTVDDFNSKGWKLFDAAVNWLEQ